VPEWARMASEWKFVVHSLIIKLHFKNSDCVLWTFQIFGHILVTGSNVLIMVKTFGVHSKWRNIERHWKCIPAALWLLSKYSYSIPTILHTFWSHSRKNENGKPLRILSECPECISNEPECTSKNASSLLPESNSILKEFIWNALPLERSSNAVGTSWIVLASSCSHLRAIAYWVEVSFTLRHPYEFCEWLVWWLTVE